MEALVNVAFDRISEDIILLYDVVAAYKETPAPQADILAVMNAISCSLTRDSERAMGRAWDIDDSRGQDPGSNTAAEGEDGCLYTQSDEEEEDIELITCDKPSQLLELARDVVTSTVSDLAVMPFWVVKVSAVAHRGRLPLLWPFVGYSKAISQILEREGLSGLFKGWMSICAAGLIRYFRRRKLLYTDYYWRTTQRVTSKFMRSDYSRYVNDPEVMAQTHEGVVTRVLWAVILHPFDLIATRMITESTPQYATMASSVANVLKHRGVSGLFLGMRSSIFNVLLPFGKWYLMGVPFLIKTRRMLDGMDTGYRAGMGGSLDMVRDILKEDGFIGLFSGCRATLWGIGPALLSLCTARIMVYMVMGPSARTKARRRRRNAHLRHLMRHPQQDGKLNKARQSEGENAGHSGGHGNMIGVRSASGGNDWRPYPVVARNCNSSV